MISRRKLLLLSALLSFSSSFTPLKCFAATDKNKHENLADLYPLTIALLKEAYWAEIIAHKHYLGYIQKALLENYPNIAYLFLALSASEKIHADNYKALLADFGSTIIDKQLTVSINDTKANLKTAAIKELEKINQFYPEIIEKMSTEAHDQSVINCMYSWKSHKQHETMITQIKTYSGWFFKPLARSIEGKKPNFFVCDICGSTVDEKPAIPCEICNYPVSHYKKLHRPTLQKS